MTAVRTPGAVPGPAELPAGPTPRRVRTPGWLDLRLVLGVLLVLASVLLGARVVSAADATVPVWSAADDLAAGTVLTAEDLVVVDVRLDGAAEKYLSGSTRPEGGALSRGVRAGELLPRSALEEPSDLVQLALPVQAGYVPPGLRRGQLVDVYAVADPAAGATGPDLGSVALVVGAAPVQAMSGGAEGVLSTPTTTVQIVVGVAADDAADVLASIAGRPLVVVAHPAGATADGSTAAVARAGQARATATTPAPAPAPAVATEGAPAPAGPTG
ncbi:Chaperone for flagella basal body P-ring formation [Blastococcus sp. DSM 46786]|uniref:SAF domain-containing protein n=1 Tax=Blastococcus sp. DSM 46786 TaxID=1798227 RepID=UPI0008D5414F|nr:flagellar biosynthesis protein FlgA [Blastococcus sp. DSM 46786]SEK23298.1 Chaperone for flagella basal body P-ring formation [Blastococcus sp. DSM 46786]